MRRIVVIAASLLGFSFFGASTPFAAGNDFLNQAQKFFNNGNDRDAYERGRDDQARHDEWQRSRQAERWRERRDADRDYRYYNSGRDPDYR